MKKTIVLMYIVIILGCSNNNPVSVSREQKYGADIETVRNDIQKIRELSFVTKVKIGYATRAEYSKEIIINKRYADELLRTYKQLCFIPDTFQDLQSYLKNYYTSFPVAYYSTSTDSITIVEPENYSDLQLMFYLSHEFTHALQDQNFGIGENNIFPSNVNSNFNSDYYITQRSLAEGDAVVAMINYLNVLENFSTIDSNYFKDDVYSFIDTLNKHEIPRYVSISSESPYVFGPDRVARTKASGGWNAVNQLYHSKRMLSSVELITGIQFTPVIFDVAPVLKNWFDSSQSVQFADDDNYGSIMLMALLSDYVDAAHCKNAFGLRGDRLIYMRSNNRQWGKLVWSLAFNSRADAIYVLRGFDQHLQLRKLNGYSSTRTEVARDSLVSFVTNGVNTSLIRQDTNLFWVENVNNPDSIVTMINNQSLAKKSAIDRSIIVNPDVIKIKKVIIDSKVMNR